jgi:hypothetical protein
MVSCWGQLSSLDFFLLFLLFSEKKTVATLPVINTVRGQTLSRSYGRLFAEFLDEESLVHLGLLDLSTCVGLRYGRLEYVS